MKIADRPMMADKEIKIIENILDDIKPKYCLEWGSGISTTYFPRGRKYIKQWLSIEHNGHYLDHIRDKCPNNVQTLWILEGASYADVVQRSNRKYNFIFIDGLDREKCLENALNILAKDGIILLHDSGRAEYQSFIKKHNGKKLIDGEEPYQGYFKHRGLTIFRGKQ